MTIARRFAITGRRNGKNKTFVLSQRPVAATLFVRAFAAAAIPLRRVKNNPGALEYVLRGKTIILGLPLEKDDGLVATDLITTNAPTKLR